MRLRARAAFLPALLGAVAACERAEPPPPNEDLFAFEADQVMVELEHVLTSDGVRQASLSADTAYFFPDRSEIHLRGLEISFFGPGGKILSVLEARSGVYDPATEDMRAEGSVVVRDLGQGRRLETERLQYFARAEELHGDTAFVFYRGNTIIRGESFISDPGMDVVRTTHSSLATPDVAVPQ